MQRDRLIPTLLLPSAGLLILVIAAALESALLRLRTHAGRTFEFSPVLWSASLAPLLLAALLLGLSWLVLRSAGARRSAGALLLVLGLPATFVIQLIRFGLLNVFPRGTSQLFTGDYFRFAGAFLAVLGLALIVKPVSNRS